MNSTGPLPNDRPHVFKLSAARRTGFGLTLGFTLCYLSLIVLIPLGALVWKTSTLM